MSLNLLNKCPSSVLNIIFSLRTEMIEGDIITDYINNNGLNNTLIKAVISGHLPIVKYLVSEGADIHTIDDYALRLASYSGHLAIVEYLVLKGANIHAQNDNALRLASEKGHLHVVKYLVLKGADIHCALQEASIHGHLFIVKYLVEQGANIHTRNDNLLFYASHYGHHSIVKYLKSCKPGYSKKRQRLYREYSQAPKGYLLR